MARRNRTSVLYSLLALFLLSGCSQPVPTEPGSFPPLQKALLALRSDFAVTVQTVTVEAWEEGSNYYYLFVPKCTPPATGFIFYPGGAVDPRAYAPFAHAIAAQGFLTAIVKMPGDFAITATDRATTVMEDYPAIATWAIGGHSLGGVSSCAYAQGNSDRVEGVVLWAAYPSQAYRIDDTDLAVISVYGTNDGVVTLDDIEASEEHLPPDTLWVPIEGGNHTQFGWYATAPDPVQPDDNPADITRKKQQDLVVDATAGFLESLSHP